MTPLEIYRRQFADSRNYGKDTRADHDFAFHRLPAEGEVIEIGAGRGSFARMATLQNPGLRFSVVDLDDFLDQDLVPSIRFLRPVDLTDPDALAFLCPGSFDVVACLGVLEHLPEPSVPTATEAISRIEAPLFLVSVANHPEPFQGIDLHPTQQPIGWWSGVFGRHFLIDESMSYAKNRGFCFRMRRKS